MRSPLPCRLLPAVAFLAAATTVLAQPRTADPLARGLKPEHFPRTIRLAENVYGYEDLRQPGFTTVSLFVVGEHGVLLADGQGSPDATRRLLDAIRAVTPKPVRWYVMGSDHGDHTAGNAVLPGGVTWVVHATSRAQLVRDSAAAAASHARAVADARVKGDTPPTARVVVVPPVAMAGDRERIDVGGTMVDIHFLGRAHTGGDLMVHLPRERILFMSEAYLNRVFPAMRSAYPSEWVGVIDRALALDVAHWIPGHGFIETPAVSREELVAFRGALVAVIDEVRRLHGQGLAVEEAIAAAQWGPLASWFLREQQAPVAVRRIYEELNGRLR